MKVFISYIFFLFCCLPFSSWAFTISGKVTAAADSNILQGAHVVVEENSNMAYTNAKGEYVLSGVKAGSYHVLAMFEGKETQRVEVVVIDKDVRLNFVMLEFSALMETVQVNAKKNNFSIGKLKEVEGTSIYSGKKTETIDVNNTSANKATNNARQVFAKIAGLNIWESDGAGIQLSIGGRGLNPNRVSNFNTRQNGYDISADALGYPESYYSPPTEAVERIEIVRGAASLQYGTQFGGFLNFKLKKGAENRKFELVSRQSFGSFNFFNSFNSVGGTLAKGKLNYYVFAQRKQGDGWRPNSQFHVNAGYAAVRYKFNEKFSVGAEYTFMDYLAHQPGGLTDAMFNKNPLQSIRARNWFAVNWNLAALHADYNSSKNSLINFRAFGLIAGRDALGILDQITRADEGGYRNLLTDDFKNVGAELRFLQYYKTGKTASVFLIGGRYYRGLTLRNQGLGDSTSEANFKYINPNEPENSKYSFPSQNVSFFAENIFRVNHRLAITPGVRFEFIDTRSDGFYNVENKNLAGQVIYKAQFQDSRESKRSFVLGGLGASYQATKSAEAYANFSQNYRSINFNDMRVVNPNFQVDPNLKDETGYTFDAGYRGNHKNYLYFDFTFFYLGYNNRIGSVLKTDTISYTTYLLRTNVSASRTFGVESFLEIDFYKWLIKGRRDMTISWFSNFTIMQANYLGSEQKAFEGKQVELVPPMMWKTGLRYKYKRLSASAQYSYTAQQYTDATNTEYTANAVNGIIPTYSILDFSAAYTCRRFTLEGSVNNALDSRYFTRRAEGYPGPGIIPSDARSFYLTLQVKL